MRILLACSVLLVFPAIALADVYVRPYVRSDGTYVQGHYRSDPDGSTLNNWSTKGNVNPYTGQRGSHNPYGSYGSSDGDYGYGSSGGSEDYDYR